GWKRLQLGQELDRPTSIEAQHVPTVSSSRWQLGSPFFVRRLNRRWVDHPAAKESARPAVDEDGTGSAFLLFHPHLDGLAVPLSRRSHGVLVLSRRALHVHHVEDDGAPVFQ